MFHYRGTQWLKSTLNAQKRQKWYKWTKWNKWSIMTKNNQKQPKMTKNGSKWLQTTQNDHRRRKRAKCYQRTDKLTDWACCRVACMRLKSVFIAQNVKSVFIAQNVKKNTWKVRLQLLHNAFTLLLQFGGIFYRLEQNSPKLSLNDLFSWNFCSYNALMYKIYLKTRW